MKQETNRDSVFPEMRAQLRTYHSIPSLQAHQDPNAYKQLQDAPRLKSILKGATEDTEQPNTIEDIKAAEIPRTNPVNLIFVLAQFAPKISEVHFDVPRDFFDLVMKEGLSSKSRATAFLWLMWWYLESDFSLKDALSNPYGPGRRSRNSDTTELPLLCPQFEFLTDEQALLENVDTIEELEFGEQKQQERIAILNGDMQPVYSGPKRGSKKAYPSNPVFSVNANLSTDDAGSPGLEGNSPMSGNAKSVIRNKTLKVAPKQEDSDSDVTREASPSAGPRISMLLNAENGSSSSKNHGRGKYPRGKDSQPNLRPKGGIDYAALNGGETPIPSNKRSRPPTSHQIALDRFRKERVDHILDKGLRQVRRSAARKRKGQTAVLRSAKRLIHLKSGYDTEEEAHMTAAGPIGAAKMGVELGGFCQNDKEMMDYGDEVSTIAQGIRRLRRRLARKEDGIFEPEFRKRSKGKGKRATRPRAEDDNMELDDHDEGADGDLDDRYVVHVAGGEDDWDEMSP